MAVHWSQTPLRATGPPYRPCFMRIPPSFPCQPPQLFDAAFSTRSGNLRDRTSPWKKFILFCVFVAPQEGERKGSNRFSKLTCRECVSIGRWLIGCDALHVTRNSLSPDCTLTGTGIIFVRRTETFSSDLFAIEPSVYQDDCKL